MQNFIKKGVLMAGLAIMGFGTTTVRAQLNASSITPAVVTVTLVDILAVVVTVPAVPLAFLTENDYKNGKTVAIPGHITVSSNRPYDLKVKSGGDLTPTLGSQPAIPISNVSVQVTSTGMNAVAAQPLSTSDLILTNSSPAAIAKLIEVTYSTAPGNQIFANTGIYTASLTYSVTAH